MASPTLIRIADIAAHEGEQVLLQGWVQMRTGKGRLHFIRLRDGSGVVQCVAFRHELNEDDFALARSLTQEAAIRVTGEVRSDARAPGLPGGYEVGVSSLELVGAAEDFPITPKEHGVEFLMDRRHLWVRSGRQWAILRIRATIVSAMRNWLDDEGFLLVDTPIITPTAGEETTTLFDIDYFGEPAFLAQTGQLYNEANIAAFGKVYCFGPTFRAEKSRTRRHLLEFWMLEPELAFCSLEELMDLQERFISSVITSVIKRHPQELALIGRDISALERIKAPFPRISYDEAVAAPACAGRGMRGRGAARAAGHRVGRGLRRAPGDRHRRTV